MTDVLKQALFAEFPRAEDRSTSTSIAMPSAEDQRYDPERLCIEWLKSEMLMSPNYSLKPKSIWQTEAQRRFSGLSERAFLRAWARALTATGAKWGKPGSKSSR
jgi:hypothetical protein